MSDAPTASKSRVRRCDRPGNVRQYMSDAPYRDFLLRLTWTLFVELEVKKSG